MSNIIKFSDMLEEVIEERDARKDRKKFCAAVKNYLVTEIREPDKKVHVTPSVLSQYIQGHTKPSFYVLVALAETLKVSLDYLVFGTDTAGALTYDEQPALRYVDRSIANLERRNEQNRQVYIAISQILAGQLEQYVDQAASQVLKKTSAVDSLAGMQDMERTVAIEKFSEETWIATRNLQLNIIKTSETEAEGPFFSTVADNLAQGRTYHCLLPKLPNHEWKQEIESFRTLLEARKLSPQQIRRFQFKETDNFPLTGVTFCKINFDELQKKQPIIYEDLQRSLYRDERGQQWIGYIQPPTVGARADLRMDVDHIKNGIPYFEAMWKNAGHTLSIRE